MEHRSQDDLRVAYERHFPALLRLAVLLSTRQNDGEDLVQEVFISAAERIPTLPEDAWLPYLRAAVVNRWKNSRRREWLERAFRRIHHHLLPRQMTRWRCGMRSRAFPRDSAHVSSSATTRISRSTTQPRSSGAPPAR